MGIASRARVGRIEIELHIRRQRGSGQDRIDHGVRLERADDDAENVVVSLLERVEWCAGPIHGDHDEEAGPRAADRIAELDILGRGHDVAVTRALNGLASMRL